MNNFIAQNTAFINPLVKRAGDAVYKIGNGGKIKVAHEAILRMGAYIQCDSKATEAGGVLLGRFIKESNDIIIDNVSVPMIGDRRSRFSFQRAKPQHQRIIDRAWLKSSNTCNYLGEWHTHPERRPTPSGVDIANWKRQLHQDIFSSESLYFIIVGTEELNIWEGDRKTLKIQKLKKV